MTADRLLKNVLERGNQRQSKVRLWLTLASTWGIMVLLSVVVLVLEQQTGWGSWLARPLLIATGIFAALILAFRQTRAHVDWRQLARRIETKYPQLDGRLLTAVQQIAPAGAELNYLQHRVIDEALASSQQDNWDEVIPKSRIVLA